MKKHIAAIIFLACLFPLSSHALDALTFERNLRGDQTYAIPPGYINTYELAASTAKAVTIPTGARFAIFGATADIWVVIGAGKTAAVPSGDTTDGSGSELNPSIRNVTGQTAMSIISESAAKVSITFYE
jgi:hypothetical protein